MINEKADALFIDFLLDNFNEELRSNDILGIIERYSDVTRSGYNRQLADLDKELRVGYFALHDFDQAFLYFCYIFKEKLHVDLFNDEKVLSAMKSKHLYLNFDFPVSDEFLTLTLNYEKLKSNGIQEIAIQGMTNKQKPLIIIDNITNNTLDTDCKINCVSYTPVAIKLPATLRRIDEKAIHVRDPDIVDLLFTPTKDVKVGFLVPKAEIDSYKKMLTPIK